VAYAILGTPKPAFFDSSGSPLASGTLTVQDPDDSSAKDTYPTADDADASTNGVSTAYTLDSRGEIATQLWGRDGEDYKVILKDSAAATIYTIDEIRLPITSTSTTRIKTADETLTDDVLANDTHLIDWSLKANTYYILEGFLLATSSATAQDIQVKFVVDNAVQDSAYTYVAMDAATANTVDGGDVQTIGTAYNIDIDGTSDIGINFHGFVFTHASAETNLDFQIAQGTDAGTSTLKKGSWIRLTPA